MDFIKKYSNFTPITEKLTASEFKTIDGMVSNVSSYINDTLGHKEWMQLGNEDKGDVINTAIDHFSTENTIDKELTNLIKKKANDIIDYLVASLSESLVTEASNINDPVLIAIRSLKMEIAKAKAAPKVRKISMNQYYKLMDQEMDLIDQMKDAAEEFEQLDSDMNAEAGQKGEAWSDADANRYGGDLDKLQTKIEKLAKQKAKVKAALLNYRMS
jgi:hypothetical protein